MSNTCNYFFFAGISSGSVDIALTAVYGDKQVFCKMIPKNADTKLDA